MFKKLRDEYKDLVEGMTTFQKLEVWFGKKILLGLWLLLGGIIFAIWFFIS